MTETLVKEVPYSLRSLINDIGFARICLPDIQRTFVWAIAKVRYLFDSMYRGYPVGYLLLWQGSTFSDLLEPSAIGNKKSLERHHLFPKHYIHKVGVKELRDTHQIANYSLVEGGDNIAISDIPPKEYWPSIRRGSPAKN